MHLSRHAAYWADLRGDHTAAVYRDQRLTWSELNQQANALAAVMQSLGVARGDRVGCLLSNRLEWVISWAATHKAGAVFVPLNPRYGDEELREIAATTDCHLLISTAEHAVRLDASWKAQAADVDTVQVFALRQPGTAVPFAEALRSAGTPTPPLVSSDDLAVITFTSGSTGRPKGAMLTHRALLAVIFSMTAALKLHSEDRTLLLAPFAFTGGLICVYAPSYVLGGCLHIQESLDPEQALATIERERISVMTGVPILWERMAASARFASTDLQSLRVATTGGAPVSAELLKKYVDKQVHIVQTYGCTEAAGYITIPSTEDGLAKPWTCGAPVLSIELRVLDAQGQECPAGETGEIVLRGEQMFSGYWRDPAASTAAWRDGWYLTGDLGRRDELGHLQITDRKKNMIISGGVNVYPAEVERLMSALPGVDEVLVFGRPDADWGERVVAVVYGTQLPTSADLLQRARQALGAYKTPKEILLSHTPLPRTASGKISRAEADALYTRLSPAHTPIATPSAGA